MTTYQVGLSLIFTTTVPMKVDFDAVIDRFYVELLATEQRDGRLIDPDITASLADMTVDVDMEVEATTVIDAQLHALTLVRTALHTVEVGTPGWEAAFAGISTPESLDLQDA